MTKIKKSSLEKEKGLLQVISDAKKKLSKLQEKQKNDIGELACKDGLHSFELPILDEAFKNLAVSLEAV